MSADDNREEHYLQPKFVMISIITRYRVECRIEKFNVFSNCANLFKGCAFIQVLKSNDNNCMWHFDELLKRREIIHLEIEREGGMGLEERTNQRTPKSTIKKLWEDSLVKPKIAKPLTFLLISA